MGRLPPAAGERLDRGRHVRFTLDGRGTEAFEGDTIGSALAAAGVVVIARSFKYHRPRGLLCMAGNCPNCLVTVDGVPNVRACLQPVREGMRVERQNAFPSADWDLLAILDRFSFALPAGFYYKAFHRPKFFWPLAEPVIRRVAGLGRLRGETAETHYEAINLHPEVLVVGGGPAGLAAAIEARRAGVLTILIDEGPEPGGWLRSLVRPISASLKEIEGLPGHQAAQRLAQMAREAGVVILSSTSALGFFEGPVVAAIGNGQLLRIWPRQIIFATGAIEQPVVFPNNDLPGIMLGGGLERLLHLYRVLPGRRVVVLVASTRGYDTAASLLEAGAAVTVVDPRLDPDRAAQEAVRQAGGRVLLGTTIQRALGRRRLRAVVIESSRRRASDRLACDLLVVTGLTIPATALLTQSGAKLGFVEPFQAFLPCELPQGIHAAGAVASARSLQEALDQGFRAGRAAAATLGHPAPGVTLAKHSRGRTALEVGARLPAPLARGPGKQFVCLCMDVTTNEVEQALIEGFDCIELLKRYTGFSMGPCQGKSCLLGATRLFALMTHHSLPETGVPTARPPWNPVPLGALAADHLAPRKETSIHDLHREAGAEFMWAGEWLRPHHYDDPGRECEAVHERVAVIDVSTLGKFGIKGPDAVELLERLYPNRFRDLKLGRIRYGAMLNDQGVILDDGTVTRLDEDEFFVTCTTGGTAAIDQWIRWWLADWGLKVDLLNMTAAMAAVNVVGPLSRQVMERLTDFDVSPAALPYLMSARGQVAGVEALILRVGFVGELGFEIHFPSAYGEWVWERIIEVGRDFGIAPFGLEAQRILRLEKQHILVGQDTDALSDPLGAGMSWMVKLEKPDFLGRQALAEIQASGPLERLVGFVIDEGGLPPEGATVVETGRPVGRVTSSRFSKAVGAAVGLAWLPAAWAEDGRAFEIAFDGERARARIHLKPFYDPDGSRLRS